MKKERYDALDGLRAYATIAVLMMHVLANGPYAKNGVLTRDIIPLWGSFVFLFMIISSFSMCCGYYEKCITNTLDIKQFYQKRFSKIWPLFALLCALDILINPSINALYEAFANLTLCFGLLPNHNISVVGVGWFLGVVFVYYMLFPFFCWLSSSKIRAWISFGIACIYNLICTVYFFDESHVGTSFAARHNFIYCAVFFAAGTLLYLYRKPLSAFSNKYRWITLLICLAATAAFYLTAGALWSALITFALYIIYALGSQRKLLNNRFTKFISGISLEIYLSHMALFRVIEKIGIIRLLGSSLISYFAVSLITVIASIAFALVIQFSFAKIKDTLNNCLKKKDLRGLDA